jgi:glutamyl-Q tRNA(Asp) synthetase
MVLSRHLTIIMNNPIFDNSWPNYIMTQAHPIITRFAPSPTGLLHLGHAYSALFSEKQARISGGQFLLRIEDIDTIRTKPEFEDAIIEDLTWLGLKWDGKIRRQSDHFDEYEKIIKQLKERNLIYPCYCSRKEIRAEIHNANLAPHDTFSGLQGPIYPGTCRSLTEKQSREKSDQGHSFALRLNSTLAMQIANKSSGPLIWNDLEKGNVLASLDHLGDVVLARKETPASYHLAVTLDDHLQGITLVTRGLDLFPSTHVHRVLQALLKLNTPTYYHHHLLKGADGRRFAKRNNSVAIRSLRGEGKTPGEVRLLAGFKD